MSLAASPTGWGFTLNDGTMVRNRSPTSVFPWLTISSAGMASIGTVDSATDRGRARLPTTTTSSSNWGGAGSACSSCAACPAGGSAPARESDSSCRD